MDLVVWQRNISLTAIVAIIINLIFSLYIASKIKSEVNRVALGSNRSFLISVIVVGISYYILALLAFLLIVLGFMNINNGYNSGINTGGIIFGFVFFIYSLWKYFTKNQRH